MSDGTPGGAPQEERRNAFGWSEERRRMLASRLAQPKASPADGPAQPTEAAPRQVEPSRSEPVKLRPSGQAAPLRRDWGDEEQKAAEVEPAATEAPAGAADAVAPAPLRPAPEAWTRQQPPAQAPAAPRREAPEPGGLRRPRLPDARQPESPRGNPQAEAAKIRLHELLIEELDHGSLEGLQPAEQRDAVMKAAKELIAQENIALGGVSRDELLHSVADEVLGLGPLEPLLRDPTVSEVMVNDIDRIFFEQDGRVFRSPTRFRNKEHVMRIVERIVSPLGRRIDEASPMVDARLPDGSRVNITIPPVSPKAPSITIRKFRADKMRMEDLIKVGALSEETAEFLAMCVRAKLNVIISGGTGTGKTTLLNALSAFIPNTERIITIEDPAELRLQQEHVITLEARPPSIEGKNAVLQRDLVRNCLRMRPDRIIVGEVRGQECFDMLQAMNTGHEGSISTVHANNPRDALARLENMVLMAGMDLPARAIREQIASAIDIFIQVQRLQDGSRKVSHVTEVSGMEGEMVTLQDIFLFKLDRVDEDGKVHGLMKPTGIRPGFAHRFAMAGMEFPNHLFGNYEDW